MQDMYISSSRVQKGFLNRYSTTSPEEDKAEVFAGLSLRRLIHPLLPDH